MEKKQAEIDKEIIERQTDLIEELNDSLDNTRNGILEVTVNILNQEYCSNCPNFLCKKFNIFSCNMLEIVEDLEEIACK